VGESSGLKLAAGGVGSDRIAGRLGHLPEYFPRVSGVGIRRAQGGFGQGQRLPGPGASQGQVPQVAGQPGRADKDPYHRAGGWFSNGSGQGDGRGRAEASRAGMPGGQVEPGPQALDGGQQFGLLVTIEWLRSILEGRGHAAHGSIRPLQVQLTDHLEQGPGRGLYLPITRLVSSLGI
jgi:hypothetical protein